MNYTVVALGKLKQSFYRQACAHYQKRLQHFAKTTVLELKDSKFKASQPTTQRQHTDSERLLAAVPAGTYTIALDERGEALSSARLAASVTRLENQSHSHLCILIGGAEGHSNTLRKTCNALWQLSSLTLPHDLARLVLLEQLYRAETIRANHPYHREG